MGITSTFRLLKFSLSAIHLFAWPVIALGYPLFASIRAVENGSIYQMRKLVIYWILLSLFSLFEFSFVKILQWIPFWSSARLVVIFWFVMPQFEGACIVYHGLVRPVLLVKLQAVIYSFFNLKVERLCKRETCLDVIENYINEYGLEALEKLIASEHESQNRIDFQRVAKTIEQEEENSAATSKQSISSAQVRDRTNATTNVKEMTPPKASAENRRCETIPLKKTQQEWTCHLCDVTNVSRSMLNAHLQGSKHKSKVESLKASLLDEIDTRPSPLQHTQSVSAARDLKGTYVDAVVRDIMQPKETAENRSLEAPLLEKTQQEWSCDLCKVTTTSEITFNGHLQTRKHKSKLEKASMLGGKDEGPSLSATSKRNDGNVAAEKLIKESCEQEKLIASKIKCGEFSSSRSSSHGDTEENNGSVASQQSHSSMHQQVHIYTNAEVTQPKAETPTTSTARKWRCCLCMVEATSEKNLNDHLRGSKHKSNFESLKMSKLPATDTDTYKVNQSNLVVTKIKAGALKQNWCNVCGLKLCSYDSVASHLKGQYWCNVCGLKLCSYDSVASHLKGKRHSSKMNLWPEKSKKVEATIPKNMP